jgi:hypothetical protein
VVLVDFLRANTDIFAWSPSDLPGIPREVAEHSLDILPHSRAVQQRLRRFDEERRWAIGVELRKLLEAGFIKEVFHPTWLLTDKRRIPLRSASVRTPHLFHHGIPKVLVNPQSKGNTSVRSTFTL